MPGLSDSDERWVRDVGDLSQRISSRLREGAPGLTEESIGSISHHLAEVAVQARGLDNLVTHFLNLAPTQQEELGAVSHELFEELREIREAIDDMSEDLMSLVNLLLERRS